MNIVLGRRTGMVGGFRISVAAFLGVRGYRYAAPSTGFGHWGRFLFSEGLDV